MGRGGPEPCAREGAGARALYERGGGLQGLVPIQRGAGAWYSEDPLVNRKTDIQD